MDITSYLLGKNASGGGGGGAEEYFVSPVPRYSNTITKITKKLPALDLTEVPAFSFSGADHLEEIEGITGTSNRTSCNGMFYECQRLKSIPAFDTSTVTNMNAMFQNCLTITTIPAFDTSNVTNMGAMFECDYVEGQYGGGLTDVPVLNTSKVTNFNSMFYGRKLLNNQSLDNILQMCINATSFTGTKNLVTLGIYSNSGYSVATIQSLPHYQDFINAGWTIGF